MRAHLDFNREPDIVTHPVNLIICMKISTKSFFSRAIMQAIRGLFWSRAAHLEIIVDSNYKGRKKSIQRRKFFAQIIVHFATQRRPLLTTNNSQLLLLVIFNGKLRRFSTRAHTIACRESRRRRLCWWMEKLQFVALTLADTADAIKTARSQRCALSGSLHFSQNGTSAYFVSLMNIERWLSAERIFICIHSWILFRHLRNLVNKLITSVFVPQRSHPIHHFAYQSSWHLTANAGKQQFWVPIGSTAEDTNNGTRWECMLNYKKESGTRCCAVRAIRLSGNADNHC